MIKTVEACRELFGVGCNAVWGPRICRTKDLFREIKDCLCKLCFEVTLECACI
ncbi:MAG: hypothetical protein BWX90_00507 [bacterium ADurb.Bin132]|nr:MAG: hypothetical protein BWX90_00507 [bacterium ADurb.Bin132]